MKSIAVAPKERRVVSGQISSARLQQGVQVFARIKHVVCALYFAILSFVFFKLSPLSLAAIQAYAPLLTACTYAALALMHTGFAARSCRRSPSPSNELTIRLSSLLPARRPSFLTQSSIHWHDLSSATKKWWRCNVSEDTFVLVFHTIELVCQNYKAFQVATYVVDKWFVGAYVSCVVLKCVVSPWLLLGWRQSSAKKRVFLSWFNSAIGFCLSCLFPLAGILPPVLQFVLVDWTLSSDHVWYTRVLLMSRIVVVSSPIDYIVKLVMDVNTLVSLHRLTGALAQRGAGKPRLTKAWSSSMMSSRPSIGRRAAASDRSVARRRPRFVVWYATCSILWGVALFVMCVQALFFRHPCPATCELATTPFMLRTCHCKYLHINCHALGNESLDVDTLMDPDDVGSTLFVLKVSRCDVRRGISNATFAHQQSLSVVIFQFTKMAAWDATLPPTLMAIQFRQCDFTSMPTVLQAKLPPLLTNLLVESTPLASLPPHVGDIWQPLTNLFFFNTSLSAFPTSLATLVNLQALYLTNQRLTNLDQTWQHHLNSLSNLYFVSVSGNSLTEVPTALRRDIALDLSCNPIAHLPVGFDTTRLTTKMVLLGDTPYCNSTAPDAGFCARATCAPGCMLWAVRDRLCDLACFNAACEYDGGDCDVYGLQRR